MKTNKFEIVILGGGCFWCLEPVFSHTRGVISVRPGYAGGEKGNPTYEEVSTGKTGHAEVTSIKFDPETVSYEELLHIFFSLHNPTTRNRQGQDIGTQYRSIILYSDEKQKSAAEKIVSELEKEKIYTRPIVTEIKPLEKFWPAEDYHQKYFETHPEKPYCQIIIAPKLKKFREKFGKYYESPGTNNP